MKKVIIMLFICINYLVATGQVIDGQIDYQNLNWNTAIQNLPANQISSGILYNKVVPFSNLYTFNRPEYNTADYEMFTQAISELYRASEQTRFISSASLKTIVESPSTKNTVKIGIINTSFQFLNFNETTPTDGGLIYQNGIFTAIPNKPSFLTKRVLICAPLTNYIAGNNVKFNFSTDLIFNNGTPTIKNLTLNFDDGSSITAINNGTIVSNSISKNFSTGGIKTITFVALLSDNSTITTYGSFQIFYRPIDPIMSNSPLQNPCYEPLKDLNVFTSTIPYQGAEESSPLYGKIECHTFYRTINNNIQKKIIKPIIIIDGFDPGDTRKVKDCDCANDPHCAGLDKYKDDNGNFNPQLHISIEDMMTFNNQFGQPSNLITTLRDLGYDVIIINNPSYYKANVAGQNMSVDGGADYIQRNAMNLVSYIQNLNNVLIANGSNEKLVIVGPSMGGQISRYALAYMDKKYAETNNAIWKHNTRLWISVDSPHLGANIPLSLQANVYCLGYVAKEETAIGKYNTLLNATAARQQLLSQFNQHENQSNFHTLFNSYYDDLNSNGVSGSNGYPLSSPTFRKIALVNGSLDGLNINDASGTSFAYQRQTFMDIRGYIDLSFLWFKWSITTFRNIDRFLPNTGGNEEIYKYFQFYNQSTYNADNHFYFRVTNNNSHGNIDVMPGGMFNSQEELQKSIFKGLSIHHQRSEAGELFPFHCFIPTFSALGHLQPNQDWANPLNYNLTCPSNRLTPFDSYYGERLNTKHTSFTQDSVDWLLKELAGNPQAPHFPIQSGLINGADGVCEGISKTYTIDEPCKVPSPVIYNDQNGVLVNGWSVEGNLQITASTPYSVSVQGTSNSPTIGKIKAIFQNGQSIEREIFVGVPNVTFENHNILSIFGWYYPGIAVVCNPVVAPTVNSTGYRWTIEFADPNSTPISSAAIPRFAKFTTNGSILTQNNIAECYTSSPTVGLDLGNYSTSYYLICYAVNDCGENGYLAKSIEVNKFSPCIIDSNSNYNLSPNPVTDQHIDVYIGQDQTPCDPPDPPILDINTTANPQNNLKEVRIYNMQGELKYSNSYSSEENFRIENINLTSGYYILNIRSSNGKNHKEIIIIE